MTIDREKALIASRKWKAKNREKLRVYSAKWRAENPGKQAELSRLWRENNPTAAKQSTITWRENNKDRHIEMTKKWREENADRIVAYSREYRLKNYEKVVDSYTKWARANPEKVSSSAACGRAARIQRIPHWLTEDDHWMMEQAYDLAALRTKMLGFPWHVDHVIPLRGRRVSGLHTPLNLQVIPAVENLKKGNKYAITVSS